MVLRAGIAISSSCGSFNCFVSPGIVASGTSALGWVPSPRAYRHVHVHSLSVPAASQLLGTGCGLAALPWGLQHIEGRPRFLTQSIASTRCGWSCASCALLALHRENASHAAGSHFHVIPGAGSGAGPDVAFTAFQVVLSWSQYLVTGSTSVVPCQCNFHLASDHHTRLTLVPTNCALCLGCAALLRHHLRGTLSIAEARLSSGAPASVR